MTVSVTLEVCEDIRFETSGQMTLVGVVSQHVSLAPNLPVKQIMFLFRIEGTFPDLPNELEIFITLPGGEPRSQRVEIPTFPQKPLGKWWLLRGVIVIQNELINLGQVEAKVNIDGTTVDVRAPVVFQSTNSKQN